MLDYLIVGSGLAGIAFSEMSIANNKSFLVINNPSQNATQIAGGLFNPVVLKRFTEVWNAKQQLELLEPFYSNLEQKLQIKLLYNLPLLRKFYAIEEQNNWFIAADKPNLTNFLSSKLLPNNNPNIAAHLGFGEVLHSGYVDTALLYEHYRKYLQTLNAYCEETFDYSEIEFSEQYLQYKNQTFRHIVFAEGFGMHQNPFFCNLPLDGTKGELLLIKAPNLNLSNIINSSIFILPIGNDLYKVGATYNWQDKTNIPTQEAKNELVNNLKGLITSHFEIIEHYAGVRPTVKDRRPLVGTHAKHNNLHIINGLGTRGVMLAPTLAKNLFENIENNIPLNKECDIKRLKNYNYTEPHS